MARLRIGEVVKASGLPLSTLRFYERMRLIHPARGPNGYRLYSTEDLHQLEVIHKAKQLGLTLAEIGRLSQAAAEGKCWCIFLEEIASRKIHEIEVRISELTRLKGKLQQLSSPVQAGRTDQRGKCSLDLLRV